MLPITPSEYEVQTSVEMTKTSIVQLGEINIAGGDKLGEIKIICFFLLTNMRSLTAQIPTLLII